MKNFKKFISLLVAVLLLIAPIDSMVFAANSEATITVDNVYGSPEGTVDVNVTIENNPGILGAILSFTYDKGLTLVNAVAGDALSSLVMSKPGIYTSPCQFAWDGESIAEEDIKDGIVITLTFEISADAVPGTSLNVGVSYTKGDVIDANLKPVTLNTVSGRVDVIDYTPGDLNGDKRINAVDIVLLRRYITGGYGITINEYAADVNDDGKINTTDVIYIRRYSAGGYGIRLEPSHGLHEHILETFDAVEATCTKEGNITYWQCTICNNYFADGDGIEEISLADTVVEKDADNHNIVIDEAVAPTTTATGLTEGSHCCECGTVTVEQQVLPVIVGYSITYSIANGDAYLAKQDIDNSENPTFYTKDHDTITLINLTAPDGYDFLGWFDGSGSNAVQIKEIPKGSAKNYQLYAHWSKKEYTITFDSPDIPWEEKTYTVDTGTTLTNPSCFGYTFMGWSNDDGFIVSRIKPGTTGHITLHANWTSDRNKATSYSSYGDPIIIEDDNNGQFLFVYNIGKIDNVPLNEVEFIGKTESLDYEKEVSVTDTISEEYAEDIRKMVSEATTRSSGWTLSKEWNDIYETKEETGTLSEKTDERTTSEGQVIGGTYFVSNSQGGSTYISTESGSSSSNSAKITTEDSVGINSSYDTSTEKYCDATLGVSNTTELSAGVEVPVKIAKVSAGVKNTTTVSAEVASGRKDNEAYHEDSSLSSYIGTVNTSDSSSYYNSTASNSSNWNSTSGYEKSYQTSIDTEVRAAITEQISKTTSHNISKALGETNSTTELSENSIVNSEEYATTFTYNTGTATTTSKSFKFNSSESGYYRIITAGTVHVYGVVGYDVATSSYYTYCFNVLDDTTREILDYSKDNMNFNDCENSVVTFEVPYEVNEYVVGVTGKTNGLKISYEGEVTDFTPEDNFNGTVVIPQYEGKDNADGSYSAVKVTSFASSAFANKDKIETVILPMYITEIPDNAFEGCTNLKKIIAYGVTKIGSNAFKGCSSLEKFCVDNAVISLGENAFEGVPEVAISAYNSTVADSAINCGAERISLNISKINDTYENKVVKISDSTVYFALIGNGGTYNNVQIISDAKETMLSNMTLANNIDTPIKSSSEKVSLSRINVSNSPAFALVLTADNVDLKLLGTVSLNSIRENTVLSKNVTLGETNPATTSSMILSGKYLVCGEVINKEFLNVEPTVITSEEFNNYLTSSTVTFDANGGTVSETEKIVYYGQVYGELPVPEKANYTFAGWYTEIDGGTQVTESTPVLSTASQTLYAQWVPNKFTVTYDANGGTVSTASKELTFGDTFGELPTPTKTGYNFVGWCNADGEPIGADTAITEALDITIYAEWSVKAYNVSWNTETGYSITVERTASPYAEASSEVLTSDSIVYYGDELSITYTADTGYSIESNGETSITVTDDVTSDTIYANAVLNSYTYNIVYKSSNGTRLGTATATYKYGTTNTISPKSYESSGYTSPSSQKIVWDSTTAKTITFIYTPTSVSTTQSVASGTWWTYNGAARLTYTTKIEYKDRTATSVKVRVAWTNKISADYYYGFAQYFNATIGGKATGTVTIATASLWASSSSSSRSTTAYSSWVTVPITTTNKTTVTIIGNRWDSELGTYSWTGTSFTVPAY